MAAVSGHMASVGRVYISTDDLDRLRAERALCPALRARQPLREQLKSCAACTMPAKRCSVDPRLDLLRIRANDIDASNFPLLTKLCLSESFQPKLLLGFVKSENKGKNFEFEFFAFLKALLRTFKSKSNPMTFTPLFAAYSENFPSLQPKSANKFILFALQKSLTISSFIFSSSIL